MSSEFQALTSRIDTAKNQFTPAEKQIASYLTTHIKTFTHLSSAEIAKACFVSKASITRFCLKLGYHDGFRELKYQVNTELKQLNSAKTFNSTKIQAKLYKDYERLLKRQQYLINDVAIQQVVQAIIKARVIYLIGLGNSGVAIMDFNLRLARFGLRCITITDGQQMRMQSMIADPQDLFIALSASGNSPDIVHTLKTAKKRHVTTILLSNFKISSASKLAAITLLYPSKNDLDMRLQISNQFAPQFVIDVIISYLIESNPNKYIDNYEATLQEIQLDD